MNRVNLFVNGNWRKLVYWDDVPEVGETVPITFMKADRSIRRIQNLEFQAS